MNVQPTNKKEWAEFLLNLNLSLDDLTRAVNFNPLIFDMTVVASGGDGVHTINGPVSSITTNGVVTLDGNAHGGYGFEVIIENTTTLASNYRMYFNNDTVNANYQFSAIFTIGGAAPGAGGSGVDAIFQDLGASQEAMVSGSIVFSVSSRPTALFTVQRSDNAYYTRQVQKKAALANLTRVDLVADATSLGVGSRVRLWRKM